MAEGKNYVETSQVSEMLELVLDAASDGLLDNAVHGQLDNLHGARTRSFESDTVLTSDAGFTLRLAGGEEFQVTIVRSR